VACALAAAPEVLFIGPILALADSDTALPLIASIRARGIGIVVLTARDVDVAHDVSRLIFVDSRGTQVGTHQELLVADTAYSRLWESRLLTTDVDLSVLGLGDDAGESLYAKLVTERFEPGMPLYRAGDPADRVIFVISGHVEIATRDAEGNSRRVAVLAPGMHCGDYASPWGTAGEDATAVTMCVRAESRCNLCGHVRDVGPHSRGTQDCSAILGLAQCRRINSKKYFQRCSQPNCAKLSTSCAKTARSGKPMAFSLWCKSAR